MTSALFHEALAPLRSDPAGSAILVDLDGTLAPIVAFAADASVPEATRKLLIAISHRYGLLACVSGRRASDARAIVSIGTITYIGAHGAETLQAGWTEAALDPGLEEWVARIDAFRREVETQELQRRRVRIEDKGPMLAFHWRSAPDQQGARAAIDAIAATAQDQGFEVHWGRKTMEVRPPLRINKGAGVRRLLDGKRFETVLYAGDDNTDLDAWRELRQLADEGKIGRAFCVGVRSDEGPPEIEQEADLVVDGPDGVQSLLAALITD